MRRFIKFFLIALTIAGCGDAPVDEVLKNANSTIVFPQVDSSSVPAGATGVSIRPNIVITFSEPMNPESVEQNLKFERAGYGQVNVIKNWFDNNKTLSLSVGNNLELNNIYLIEISSNAMSQAGYKMRNDFTTHFTTSHIDNEPPVVIGTSPEDGAVNVPGGQNIVVYFSKDMNKMSAEQAFSLKDSSGQSISGTFSWAGSNMIFTPGVKLKAFENYTINISKQAMDYMSNLCENEIKVKFTAFGKYLLRKSIQTTSKYFQKQPRDITIIKDNDIEYIYVCDSGNNRIIKYKKNIIPAQASFSYVYVKEWGEYGSSNGKFITPYSIAHDSNFNIYVADRGNNRIQKFDKDGNWLNTWGSYGTNDSQFMNLNGITIDSNNNVFTSEGNYAGGNNRIQKFDKDGNFILKWGTQGTGDNQFNQPTAIDVDSLNNIYVLDSQNHVVKKFDNNGNYIIKWGGIGYLVGQFGDTMYESAPMGLCIDKNDNIYIADNCSFYKRISKFTNSGVFISRFDTTPVGYGRTAYQAGICIDESLNIYQCDYGISQGTENPPTGCVRMYSQSGAIIHYFGNIISQSGLVIYPLSITFDDNNNVYIYDKIPPFVKVLSHDFIFLRNWGDSGTEDGKLNTIESSILYRNGNIYIGDYNRVQIFDIYGNYQKKLNSNFLIPKCFTQDSDNNLFILDYNNHRIQKFNQNDDIITANWKIVYYTLWMRMSKYNSYYELFESNPYTIKKFDMNNSLLNTWPKNGHFSFDNKGNFYLVNRTLNRFEKYNSEDNLLISFGNYGTGEYEFRFESNPVDDVAIDNNGDMYIIDSGNRRIQVYTPVSE